MENALIRLEQALSPGARVVLGEKTPPRESELMQPIPMAREDPGAGWLFEPFFDGTRCLAVCDGSSLRLFENGTRALSARYPALEGALVAAGPRSFAVDGEILKIDPKFEKGLVLPEGERVRNDVRIRNHEYRFLAFDLLNAVGCNLTALPLLERRNALRALFRFSPTVMYVRESSAPGELVFSQAEREQWVGVVAKRGESPYVPGKSPDWRFWRCPDEETGGPEKGAGGQGGS